MKDSPLNYGAGFRQDIRGKRPIDYTAMDWAATIDPDIAYERSYHRGSRGMGHQNSVKAVKNDYEIRLKNYLKKLPPDPDFGGIPDGYQAKITEFLQEQKRKYVNAANSVDEYEVGSKEYMDRVAEMNQISKSFKTLQSQFDSYGENKKEIIEAIENGTTSLYGENQKNVNFLRGVYNEEFDLGINEDGNISFLGEDGAVNFNDLPGYEPKDFSTAKSMMDMGVNVYKSGKELQPGGIMYNQYANQLRMQIDEGGESRLMSVIHDGLVGGTPMIEDPLIKQQYDLYQNGEIDYEDLRNAVVDNYMKVLVKQSEYGVGVNQVKPSKSDAKYVAGIEMIGGSYMDALQNGNLSGFNHSLPTGWSVDWEDEDEGIINIFKGDYSEYTLNLNDPKSLYTFLNINKIPKHLWPKMNQPLNNQNVGTGGGGSYDDL